MADPLFQRFDAFILQADQPGKGMHRAILQPQQGKLVAQEPPAAFAQQRGHGGFARSGHPGHHQRAAILLRRAGVQQQMPPPAQRHLQVHAHFCRQQPLRKRQRRSVRQHVIARDHDRGPQPLAPRTGRFQPDRIVAIRRRGIRRVKALERRDGRPPGGSDAKRRRADADAQIMHHGPPPAPSACPGFTRSARPSAASSSSRAPMICTASVCGRS